MGTKLHQFFMSKDSCRYVFKNGKIAVFEGGVYRTTIDQEADELKEQIDLGIGAIWQESGQEVVDSDDIDPVAVFKRKVIAEYEAEKARSLDNGESFSDVSKSGKPTGTKAMGGNAAQSTSGAATVVGGVPAGSIKVS